MNCICKKNFYLFVIFIIIAGFLLKQSYRFKYYSEDYNYADSAVYNQVMNSIIFSGQTGSSLEIGGEQTTFKIHFSPVFYLLAPFKIFYFNEFTLDIIQVMSFVSGVIILISIFKLNIISSLLIICGIVALPQNIGLLFTSFRTVKLSFLLCIWLYWSLSRRNRDIIIPFILLLSLIETNYPLCFGIVLYIFTVKKNYKLSLLLLMILIFFSVISLYYLEYNRHIDLFSVNMFSGYQMIKYLFLMFIPFLFFPVFNKKFIIVIVYIFIMLISDISLFFGFNKTDFLSKILFYYIIPVITFSIIIFLEFFCGGIFKKSKYLILIFFLLFSLIYGFKQNKCFFNKLNALPVIEYEEIRQLKRKIPVDAKLYVQWFYADLFSDFSDLNFYITLRKNTPENNSYTFIDLTQNYIDSDDKSENLKREEIMRINKLIDAGLYKKIYFTDRYLLLYYNPIY